MNFRRTGGKAWLPFWSVLTTWAIALLLIATCTHGQPKFIPLRGESKMAFPNYQKCDDSPILPEKEVGIRVSFAGQAFGISFSKDGPWPLFGTYRVGQDILSDFGTQIDPHVLIVVTHKESRGIYTGRILKDDLPGRSIADTADKGGQVISTGSYFNVDLKKQCRIPGNPGKYWVVVLLGRMTSPVLEFEVK